MKLELASTMWVVSRTPGENRILEILAEGTGPVVNSTTPPPSDDGCGRRPIVVSFSVVIRDRTD